MGTSLVRPVHHGLGTGPAMSGGHQVSKNAVTDAKEEEGDMPDKNVEADAED